MKDYKAALLKETTKPKSKSVYQEFHGKPSGIPRSFVKPKSVSKRELWALYGLNRPSKPRYEGLKGIYWHVVSEYARRRDFEAWRGQCISCGKRAETWQHLQGGHFIAAATCGFKLLFDLRNVNGECSYCNGCDPNHLLGYERGLDERYGDGFAQTLKDEYRLARHNTPAKAWNDKEYDVAIRELQGELANF